MSTAVTFAHSTLESFFFEEMEQRRARGATDLPQEVEAYVVGLLARYARRTQVAGRRSKPLALQYLSARSAQGAIRAQAMRGVGDRALYIAGVVPRSLTRTPVNVKYVRGIGEAAYGELGNSGPLEVFSHLAEMFSEVSDAIADIVDHTDDDDVADLMGLYERWRSGGDPRDLRRLIRAGVLIDGAKSDIVQ